MKSTLGHVQVMRSLTVIVSLVTHAQVLTPALAANPGFIVVNELASSPNHITAMKNSAVWLHWNYTYGGDISAITYKEQIIRCNSSSQPFQPLAERTSLNGALSVVSPLPSEFSGRIEVIPSNSTLVIKNLQLNDSSFTFSSQVVLLSFGSNENIFDLKPSVRISIQGVPEFTVSPPSSIQVYEGTPLTMAVEMNGNPPPTVDFSWSHLAPSQTSIPGIKIYPFVFSSTYRRPGLDASFCGRNLITLAKNSAGSSLSKLTNVTVLLKLDVDPKLEAGKIADQRCVEVKWNKAESGLCFVKYEVKFKNASGNIIYTEIGYNINSKKKCSIPEKINITNVELTMSFMTSSKTTTVKVSENPIPTTASPTTTQTTQSPSDPGKQTGPSTGVIVGATFGGVIFLILVILLILFVVKKSTTVKKKRPSSEPGVQL